MTIEELADECWALMRPALFRRAILGRRRCTELVMCVVAAFPSSGKISESRICRRVEAKWKEKAQPAKHTYEAVFRVIVLPWAIRGIVSHVAVCSEDKRLCLHSIRHRYGWSDAEES